ncbi:exodeoxyribonuclease VII large subunit [Pseudoalteromonas sp. SSM20]|uniref:exodeoxyribonuclease VII large subunit n=1 Tax=Pseudoalteromonas sp. SSM20 TaxID=3139394 RepID=UPI003BACDE9F
MLQNQIQKIYTVSLLNKEIRYLLEQNFFSLQLTGEISNFIAPSSGHWYFSLKDDNAQIRAAMWRGNNRSATFKPKNGDQVLVRARVSLYEPRGDYQLIVEHIEPAGEGQLKQEFDALKIKLAGEGLFASEFKKPLPNNIRRLGVITSPTGAAIKDILTVLEKRAPQLEVVIYPTLVQGNEAHLQLIEQLQLANQRNEVDVIIIGRGGGSMEDLWCFNHEMLARAIFASQLPVVSAVGHEIDTTISDYVADLRAATPSQAAEIVSPDKNHLTQHIDVLQSQLHQHMVKHLQVASHNYQVLEQRLLRYHPNNRLNQQAQLRDELEIRLLNSISRQLESAKYNQHALKARLEKATPQTKLTHASQNLQNLVTRLHSSQAKQLEFSEKQLAVLAAKLNATSPLAVLARGYSMTQKDNKVVNSVEQLNEGDHLITQFADGHIQSTVTQVSKRDDK